MYKRIKYFIQDLKFLRTYISPFKPIIPKIYIGKTRIGVPYYIPQLWISFRFVGVEWNYRYDDYIFESNPIISFIFLKWQLALIFRPIKDCLYWESWLFYTRDTNKNKSVRDRVNQMKKEYSQEWTVEGKKVDYYNLILKKKYL